MVTSLIEILELPNFGHMTISTIYIVAQSSGNLCKSAFEGSNTNLGYDEHCEGESSRA